MAVRTAGWNISGKRVTTLIPSIALVHGDQVVPPRVHDRPGRDAHESQQPLAVVRTPPRDHQGTRHDLPLRVDDEQPGLRREHRARILHQGEHGHFPSLPVRLAHPPDYAGRWPPAPAYLRG